MRRRARRRRALAFRDFDRRWREDRGTGPLPAVRCGLVLLLAVGVAIARWSAGIPRGWTGLLPALIIAVVLLLPDLSSFAFGGLKLEMRETRGEVGRLRDQVQVMQIQQASASATVIVNDPRQLDAVVQAAVQNTLSEQAGRLIGDSPSSALGEFLG